MKTKEFLQEILHKNNIPDTHYGLAKYMGSKYGWTRTTIINYRNGKTYPDDKAALDIATELEIDPMYVIASIHTERAKEPKVKKIWKQVADKTRPLSRRLANDNEIDPDEDITIKY